MLRWLYIQFIWLHPAPFRWRFGDDMLDDFDRATLREKPRYFTDAAISLARQWLLRPEFRRPQTTAHVSLQPAGTPLFQTIETYQMRPAVLLHGGLLAALSILAAVILIGKGGSPKPFFIDAYSSRKGLLPVDLNSSAPSDLKNPVKPGTDPDQVRLKLAGSYFLSMPVLRVLDSNRNLTLSPWEIGNAPTALRKLDTHHAGKLRAEECGLRTDQNSVGPSAPAQRRRQFMSYHPVLAALDADHDGEISAGEIDHAAVALKKLDRNHDGYLTVDELLPIDMAIHAGLR